MSLTLLSTSPRELGRSARSRPHMKPRQADAIASHLTGRRVLSTAEERRLDLDGDGRLTSRDLLIAASGRNVVALPVVLPETRRLRPGQSLVCTLFGPCPDDLRAS